jgi:hypothetical protein
MEHLRGETSARAYLERTFELVAQFKRVFIKTTLEVWTLNPPSLAADGFSNVVGVDPHVPSSRTFANGSRIIKGELDCIEGHFDVVMFNHSFEHVSNPYETLVYARRLLTASSHVLIRIPVADSWAFRHYESDWVAMLLVTSFFSPNRDSRCWRCPLGIKSNRPIAIRMDFSSGEVNFTNVIFP